MKFKVVIITKLACYGIKIYVMTYAETSYVIKYIFYKVKAKFYSSATYSEEKEIMQVVKSLCESFTGTYRKIYDRVQLNMSIFLRAL